MVLTIVVNESLLNLGYCLRANLSLGYLVCVRVSFYNPVRCYIYNNYSTYYTIYIRREQLLIASRLCFVEAAIVIEV